MESTDYIILELIAACRPDVGYWGIALFNKLILKSWWLFLPSCDTIATAINWYHLFMFSQDTPRPVVLYTLAGLCTLNYLLVIVSTDWLYESFYYGWLSSHVGTLCPTCYVNSWLCRMGHNRISDILFVCSNLYRLGCFPFGMVL